MALFSCKPIKNVYYVKEIIDSNKVMVIEQIAIPIPLIQPYDILRINYYGKGLDMTMMLNNFGGLEVAEKMSSSTSTSLGLGYLVSPDGFIELPQLGKIKVVGMTLVQLKADLTERASKIMVEPTVIVKFASFKVSMIGEVGSKGVVTTQSEKLSILEALGLSGDISLSGLKDNVKVIRTTDTSTTIGTIDLTSKDFFKSEYFYLKPNDIVYVPSDGTEQKQKKFNSTLPYFSLFTSVVSLLISILLFTRN
jgi:polysaccharide biosynthesis/export protein